VRVPYLLIAGALLLLGLGVAFMHLPHVEQTQAFRPAKAGDPILSQSIWGYKHTVLGALGIFFYVGVEVGLGRLQLITSNARHEHRRDRILPGLALLVRRARGPLARILDSDQGEVGNTAGHLRFAAAALIALSMVTSGWVAIWTLVLCGFFNSIMFPTSSHWALPGWDR